MPEVVEEASFQTGEFEAELAEAPSNRAVGTSLWFEDVHVRVWEVRLRPGERAPFHCHVLPYFWTCVDAGTGRQRSDDGFVRIVRYDVGDTVFSEHSDISPKIHDLENMGDSLLRFVTVELLAGEQIPH